MCRRNNAWIAFLVLSLIACPCAWGQGDGGNISPVGGLRVSDPEFCYKLVELTAASPRFARHYKVQEKEAVEKVDRALAYQFPDQTQAIISGEADARYRAMYRKVVFWLVNDYPVAAQIAWTSVADAKARDETAGVGADMNFLKFNNFMHNLLMSYDEEPPGMHGERKRRDMAVIALRPVHSIYLRTFAQWSIDGMLHDDAIAYEAGMSALDAQKISPQDRQAIKKAFAPYAGHRFLGGPANGTGDRK